MIFVTGGVRSGKSAFAEKICSEMAEHINGQLHYIACGKASDSEMELRIKKHRKDREQHVLPWRTWELSTDIKRAASSFNEKSVVLLDCLTTLLSNEMFSHESMDAWEEHEFLASIKGSILDGVKALQQSSGCLVIVSNELFWEPFSHEGAVGAYRRTLGELHQQIVELANKAYLLESGIPLLMKGES